MFHGHDRSLSVLYVARWSRVRSPVPAGIHAPHGCAAREQRPEPSGQRDAGKPARSATFRAHTPGFLTLGRFHHERAVPSPRPAHDTCLALKRCVFAIAGACPLATLRPQVRVEALPPKPESVLPRRADGVQRQHCAWKLTSRPVGSLSIKSSHALDVTPSSATTAWHSCFKRNRQECKRSRRCCVLIQRKPRRSWLCPRGHRPPIANRWRKSARCQRNRTLTLS